MKIFSKNTWGVDVNNAWQLTCKASCLKKIELRPLISGFDFALLEVRNLCVASRLFSVPLTSFFNDVKICVTSYFMYGVSHEGKYCTFNKILVRKAQISVESSLVYQSVSQKSILCDVYFITLNFMILI